MNSSLGPKQNLLSAANLKAAGVGALGAFGGSLLGDTLISPFFPSNHAHIDFSTLLLEQALLFGFPGVVVSELLLAYDNQAGLRGRWDRDLLRGLPLFALLAFFSGGLGQLLYTNVGLTRGLPWMMIGTAIGAGIGLLRSDKIQAQRGALGGAVGGLLGGLLVDAMLSFSRTDASFALASLLGIVITGAAIALMMRVTQDAMKSAWLLGISTGPYEGKEYPLNTARVTVGTSELNDIALFRETAIPAQLGAFVFQNEAWWWQGTPVTINGAFAPTAQLRPGDTIQLGATNFRFQMRSVKGPAPALPAYPAPGVAAGPYPPPPGPYAPPPGPYPTPGGYAPPSGTYPNPGAYVPPPTVAGSPAPGASSAPGVPSALPTSSMESSWVLLNASPSGSSIRLPSASGQVRLGRAPTNQIVLSDPSVSSNHAIIEVRGAALFITDQGSTNGTRLNGIPIPPHTETALRDNDRLGFGTLEYTVRAS